MRKQIELLENHAYFAANLGDIAHIVTQRNAVHDNVTFLMFFQPIDAADKRRFSGTGRALKSR